MTVAPLETVTDGAARAPGSADVAALVAPKLRCIAPMIAVSLTAYTVECRRWFGRKWSDSRHFPLLWFAKHNTFG